MRNRCRWLLLSLVMTVLVISPLFAGGENEKGQTHPINLLLMHDKGATPDYQPYFLAAAQDVKAKFGYNLISVPYPGTEIFTAALKAVLPTPKSPDFFTWWYRYWAKGLIDEGSVVDTTALWDKHKDDIDPGIRQAYTFDGKVYGINWGIDYWIQYYNKDVFAKLNLSVPKTWDDFISVCETLKKNGVVPLNQTVADGWPTFITFQELCIRTNPSLYEDLVEGRAKYTDPEAREVFKLWQDLMKKGYFTDPSTNYFSDMPRMFNEDKLGIIMAATWYYGAQLISKGVPASKIGFFLMPPVKPTAGKAVIVELSPIFISKKTENLQYALQVADFWMSPEGSTFLSKHVGNFPTSLKADTSYLAPLMKDVQQEVRAGKYKFENRFWEATPTELMLKINEKFGQIITDPDKMDQVILDIQALADGYWAKVKK